MCVCVCVHSCHLFIYYLSGLFIYFPFQFEQTDAHCVANFNVYWIYIHHFNKEYVGRERERVNEIASERERDEIKRSSNKRQQMCEQQKGVLFTEKHIESHSHIKREKEEIALLCFALFC